MEQEGERRRVPKTEGSVWLEGWKSGMIKKILISLLFVSL